MGIMELNSIIPIFINLVGGDYMFTRFLEAILWFLCLAGLAISISIGVKADSIGLCLIGLVITAFALLLLGVFTELCSNVMSIKNSMKSMEKYMEMLCMGKSIGEVNPNQILTPNQVKNLNQIKASEESEQWTCRKCFTVNDKSELMCTGCGAAKQGTAKNTEKYIQYRNTGSKPQMWTCAKCGRGNDSTAKICNSCNAERNDLLIVPEGYWRCNNCATVIGNEYKKCWYCGSVNSIGNVLKQEPNTQNKEDSEVKTCPTCKRQYAKEGYVFCNDCGSRLV